MKLGKAKDNLFAGQAAGHLFFTRLFLLAAGSLGFLAISCGQQSRGEGALSGDFSADAETRVVIQADGKRTTYERSRMARSLEAVTYESLESDVVVQRKLYELGPQGQELVCRVRDARNNLIYTVLYSYDDIGRRKEEGTYDAQGKLIRVVGFGWKDGRQLQPAVTLWRQDGVMWIHAADGSGVIPMPNQESLSGKSNEDLKNVKLSEEPIEAAFIQDDELRRGLLDKQRRGEGGMISLDEQIQALDAQYMKEKLSPEEQLIMERWRRKAEQQAQQR